MSNILHRIDDAVLLKQGQMVLPSFVDFHTSNVCNMHCLGCAYDGTLDGQMMSQFDHFRAVDIFLENGVKAFDFAGGGEPTCLPYLPGLMRHIARHDAHFALITNGVLMSQDLIDVLVESGTYCRISLEASDRESYSLYKRVPAHRWDCVIANIERLVAERNRRKSELEISLKFAVGKSLRGGLHYHQIQGLIESLGVDGATVKALRHEPEELSLEEKRTEAHEFSDYRSPKIRHWILPDPNVPQCYLNPIHAVMDYRGDLFLCCYAYVHGPSHRIGNIFDGDFRKLWFGEEHKRKVAEIDRERCATVDCKFFKWHWDVERFLTRGAGYWL